MTTKIKTPGITDANVTTSKLDLISTSSVPGATIKGTSGQSDGYIQLNCEQNTHGIKLKSPPHSAAQSYTLTFPQSITNGYFLKTDGSGNLSFAEVSVDPPVAWQSSIITAATLSAVVGYGYWIDTTSNACTITLPASASVGDQIIFVDYARRWGINAITINQNSLNFQGSTSPNPVYSTAGQTLNIVYSGATRGWTPISDDAVQGTGAGGFPDYTGIVEVVAGGGSGGNESGGGGGAGGFQSSSQTFSSGDIIAITVGAGGASVTGNNDGNNGGASSMTSSGLTDVTSAGGGNGGTYNGTAGAGGSGGGGGGGGNPTAGGAGNTPSTSPSQGNSGGNGVWTGSTYRTTGGGGGISAVGVAGNGGTTMGNGGAGKTNSLGVAVCGGGGGGANAPLSAVTVGTGGTGGGGLGGSSGINGTNGTTGTGGGGGGGGVGSDFSGAGGKGYVSLTIPVAYYSGSYNGFPVVDIGSTNVTLTFSGTGSYIV